jgi:RNA polymerase-binding transcription factor
MQESHMIGTTKRDAALQQLLTEHRRELQDEVRRRLHDGRVDRPQDGRDVIERADHDSQGDLGLALLQLKAEMLGRMHEALIRLDSGGYGSCVECECEIEERRLRALPSAVRCQTCEGRRERAQGEARQMIRQRDNPSTFVDSAWR